MKYLFYVVVTDYLVTEHASEAHQKTCSALSSVLSRGNHRDESRTMLFATYVLIFQKTSYIPFSVILEEEK